MIPPRRKTRALSPQTFETPKPPMPGDRVEIFWDGDGTYFPATLHHPIRPHAYPFVFHVVYDDGDRETLDLDQEFWRYPDYRSMSASFVPGHAQELWETSHRNIHHVGETVFSDLTETCEEFISEKRGNETVCRVGECLEVASALDSGGSVNMFPIKVRFKFANRHNI